MDKHILTFNLLALAGSLLLCAGLFAFTALPEEAAFAAQTPLAVEDFPDVDLGDDYGPISVTELMGYYIENPPAAKFDSAARRRHFGGC